MLRFFGIYFIALVVSGTLIFLDRILPGNYFSAFIDGHFIETYSCLVGFNIASVIFLIGQLIALEEKYNKEFKNTKKEIKHNSFYLLFSLFFSIIILMYRPNFCANCAVYSNIAYYIFNTIVFSLFLLSFFSIFEILSAVFTLGKNDL